MAKVGFPQNSPESGFANLEYLATTFLYLAVTLPRSA